jgi:hypothetical protein
MTVFQFLLIYKETFIKMKKVFFAMDVSCFISYGDSVGEVAKVFNENAFLRQSLLNE